MGIAYSSVMYQQTQTYPPPPPVLNSIVQLFGLDLIFVFNTVKQHPQ